MTPVRPRRLWKSCAEFDGVLAGHGVGDEEDLLRIEQLFELGHFIHEFFVDVEAAGGVDDEGVAGEDAGFATRFAGQAFDKFGAGGLIVELAFVEAGFDGLGDDLELLARGGAVDVDGDEHGAMAAFFEPGSQLAAGCGFAGALQAGHQDDGGRLRGEFEAGSVAAEEFDQLVADDLDDLLGGRERGKHLGANGFGADVLDEFVDDVEIDVGIEHGDADLFEGLIHVFFRESALAPEGLEGSLQLFCKVLKHRSNSVYREEDGRRDWGRRDSGRRDWGHRDEETLGRGERGI